ncbi:hypothetical protein BH10BAC1_BH10BAC1_08230 [soil metagenome]
MVSPFEIYDFDYYMSNLHNTFPAYLLSKYGDDVYIVLLSFWHKYM